VPSLTFSGIGTDWQIDTDVPISAVLEARILSRVEVFDATYSRFRSDSLVSRVSEKAGTFEFPDDAPPLFALYDTLYSLTGGAVTPLIGQALELLGYGRDYALTPSGSATAAAEWPAEVVRQGKFLTARSPVLIDVGAAGKGHLADLVGEVLAESGITDFVIDASGDILASGVGEVVVALEHPFDPSMAIGTVNIQAQSICASGSNRRVWGEGLHHILDGRTGTPTRDVVATWAIAATALEADGLATALFFTEPSLLDNAFEFDYVRLFSNGTTQRSAHLNGELF
jgi:thiamine biosynthesis lipoprotein